MSADCMHDQITVSQLKVAHEYDVFQVTRDAFRRFTQSAFCCCRPPHGTDGTPNESANDVLIRVRQVILPSQAGSTGSFNILLRDSDRLYG